MPLTTPRLILRPWREADRAPLAAITGERTTMRFFAAARTRAQSDAWMDRAQAHIERHGYGVWAAELPATGLIGFVGLSTIPSDLPVAPGVELVWTLGAAWWGNGYAPEAARAAAADGFARFGLAELVAFYRRGERTVTAGDGKNRHANSTRSAVSTIRAFRSGMCCAAMCSTGSPAPEGSDRCTFRYC